jgi:carboxypeptidase D
MYLADDPTFTGNTPFEAYKGQVPAENTTFKYGVLPSNDPLHTANTTGLAARTMWHFSQAWFTDFPEWKTSNKRVSLW